MDITIRNKYTHINAYFSPICPAFLCWLLYPEGDRQYQYDLRMKQSEEECFLASKTKRCQNINNHEINRVIIKNYNQSLN